MQNGTATLENSLAVVEPLALDPAIPPPSVYWRIEDNIHSTTHSSQEVETNG